MKKLFALVLTISLLCGLLIGCGKKSDDTSPTGNGQTSSSASLSKIKQAAKDAGYDVGDSYFSFGLDDIKGGFTVRITLDRGDVTYSVVECGSEASAKKNAETIDKAGYNIAATNGKILTYYGVDDKGGPAQEMLVSIINGNPIAPKTK